MRQGYIHEYNGQRYISCVVFISLNVLIISSFSSLWEKDWLYIYAE